MKTMEKINTFESALARSRAMAKTTLDQLTIDVAVTESESVIWAGCTSCEWECQSKSDARRQAFVGALQRCDIYDSTCPHCGNSLDFEFEGESNGGANIC